MSSGVSETQLSHKAGCYTGAYEYPQREGKWRQGKSERFCPPPRRAAIEKALRKDTATPATGVASPDDGTTASPKLGYTTAVQFRARGATTGRGC